MDRYRILAFSVTECTASHSPLTWSTLSQKGDKIAADRLVSYSFTIAPFPNTHMKCGGWRENAALQLSLLLPRSVVYIKWNNDTPVPRYNSSVPLNAKN